MRRFKTKKTIQFTGACACFLVLSACAVHDVNPEPVPNIELQESFPGSDVETPQELSGPWWQSFEREALNTLVEEALAENQTVLQAMAVFKQAEAVTQRTRSDLFPQMNLEGDASKPFEDGETDDASTSVGAALSWEVDIFNRIGAATQADRYEARARAEDIEAVKLALSAEVANAYFGAATAHRRLELLQEQLRLDRELQDLLQLRLDNGVGTSVDVLRQQARVADSQTLIPLAEADLAVFENRLDVLVGEAPDGMLRVPQTETLGFSETLPPLSVPAALLLNRPDLKSQRAELIAADADIGAAIADRLPRITLNGSYLYSDTPSLAGPVGMLMGAFVQPLLDWGKRKAEVERNEALYEERLAAYTQSYLEAVEDVENALVRENKQREFLERLRRQRDILRQTVDASEDRYTQGIDDYLPVIDALQELRSVERTLIAEELNLITFRINLHRAIGGPIYAKEENNG